MTSKVGSVRAAALRLLGRRDYTSAEIRQRLLARGHGEDETDGVVTQLTAEGLIDDRRAAAAHVRTAAQVKGRGRVRIGRELTARGIAPDITADALAALPEEDEAAALQRVLGRKRLAARLSMAERRRIFQQLLRRGFRSDAIARALRLREEEDS